MGMNIAISFAARREHHTPEVGTQEHTDWLILQRYMGIE